EAVAVHVPDVTTLAARDEPGGAHRVLVIALGVGVTAPGDDVVRSLAQRFRALVHALGKRPLTCVRTLHAASSVAINRASTRRSVAAATASNGSPARSATSSRPCSPSARLRTHCIAARASGGSLGS